MVAVDGVDLLSGGPGQRRPGQREDDGSEDSAGEDALPDVHLLLLPFEGAPSFGGWACNRLATRSLPLAAGLQAARIGFHSDCKGGLLRA